MSKKLQYQYVKEFIESVEGYELISKTYKSLQEHISIKCQNGHVYQTSFCIFRCGCRCPKCKGVARYTYEQIRQSIHDIGYELISETYKNVYEKLDIRCDVGHIFQMCYHDIDNKHKCPKCFGKFRHTIEYIKEYISGIDGYKALLTKYINNSTKIPIECPKKHVFEMSFNNFQRGHRCPKCAKLLKRSKGEIEIFEYVKTIYDGSIIPNDTHTIFNPKTGRYVELDIYCKDISKAIEFGYKYYHTNNYKDRLKVNECKRLGINLLVIDYNDWVKNKDLGIIHKFILG